MFMYSKMIIVIDFYFLFQRIDDFLNKGTNLQKYKKDAEQKTSALMNTLKDKETEIGALREQLARFQVL